MACCFLADGTAHGLGTFASARWTAVRPSIHFGIFVAFATIYPRVEMFLRIMVKWIALALGAILTLQLFAAHAWPQLAVLWLSIGAAFLFIRMRGIGPELEWWSAVKEKFQPKPKFQVVPRSTPRRVVEPENVYRIDRSAAR